MDYINTIKMETSYFADIEIIEKFSDLLEGADDKTLMKMHFMLMDMLMMPGEGMENEL